MNKVWSLFLSLKEACSLFVLMKEGWAPSLTVEVWSVWLAVPVERVRRRVSLIEEGVADVSVSLRERGVALAPLSLSEWSMARMSESQ